MDGYSLPINLHFAFGYLEFFACPMTSCEGLKIESAGFFVKTCVPVSIIDITSTLEKKIYL